jgi:aspartate/methionine/tyrosine aminotransferase
LPAGCPAAETFPDFGLAAPTPALQYGPTEGDPRLRERIATTLRLGLDCGPERVLVLSGSQQGIDLVGKLFIDPGTPVAVESPTYLAALQVFRFFGARCPLHAGDAGRKRIWPQPAGLCLRHPHLPEPHRPLLPPPSGSPGENLR